MNAGRHLRLEQRNRATVINSKDLSVSVLDKILRAGEGKILRTLESLAAQVNALEEHYVNMSDEELRGLTADFKLRISNGESLDDLLPEAFAAVREASKRTLGQRHYDVQLMGGAALHLGNIAEMRTGEGKTLVSTCVLPVSAFCSPA